MDLNCVVIFSMSIIAQMLWLCQVFQDFKLIGLIQYKNDIIEEIPLWRQDNLMTAFSPQKFLYW